MEVVDAILGRLDKFDSVAARNTCCLWYAIAVTRHKVPDDGHVWGRTYASTLAKRGHFEVLKWARANGCPWDEATCAAAADGGHVSILEWAIAEGCPTSCETYERAAKRGRFCRARMAVGPRLQGLWTIVRLRGQGEPRRRAPVAQVQGLPMGQGHVRHCCGTRSPRCACVDAR